VYFVDRLLSGLGQDSPFQEHKARDEVSARVVDAPAHFHPLEEAFFDRVIFFHEAFNRGHFFGLFLHGLAAQTIDIFFAIFDRQVVRFLKSLWTFITRLFTLLIFRPMVIFFFSIFFECPIQIIQPVNLKL
jgi:hypothetical protein